MRNFINIVTEAFNTPVPYRWVERGQVTHMARFKIGPMVYDVMIERYGREPEVEINFTAHRAKSGQNSATLQATGTGNAQAVYSTVLAAVDDYLGSYNDLLERIVIESDTTERSRHAVNTRIASRIAQKWGYTVENDAAEGKLVLHRDGAYDDEDEDESAYA